jgi:hypothetical protein
MAEEEEEEEKEEEFRIKRVKRKIEESPRIRDRSLQPTFVLAVFRKGLYKCGYRVSPKPHVLEHRHYVTLQGRICMQTLMNTCAHEYMHVT